ncbi:MAG: nicotinamide riboside transporter PnuC [Flavobacteriales bacterium]
MQFLTTIEILSVLFNFIFLILLIKENKWCWPNGIIGSLLSVYLFTESKLYSEAILYAFYVLAGIYGWLVWSGYLTSKKDLKISTWKIKTHFIALLLGIMGMLSLGYYFDNFSDGKKPYFDAFSTSFSFVATYMEAHKILGAWAYWIILNFFSVWLYSSRNLSVYAGLMVVYAMASVWGLIEWRKKYKMGIME